MRFRFVLPHSIPRHLPILSGRRRLKFKLRESFQIVLQSRQPALAFEPDVHIRGGGIGTPKSLAIFASGFHLPSFEQSTKHKKIKAKQVKANYPMPSRCNGLFSPFYGHCYMVFIPARLFRRVNSQMGCNSPKLSTWSSPSNRAGSGGAPRESIFGES